jgi:hypothetical protein
MFSFNHDVLDRFLVKPAATGWEASGSSVTVSAALAIVIVSVAYAAVLNRRDPALGDRVGSIIADE